MRLIITEKPSIVKALNQADPDIQQDDIIYTLSNGLFSATYPTITLDKVPATPVIIEDTVAPHFRGHNPMYRWLSALHMITGTIQEMILYIRSRADRYTEVIVAVDNDRVGYYGAQQLLSHLNLPDRLPVHYTGPICSYTPESLKIAFQARQAATPRIQSLIAQQRLKRQFDFWWRLNAQPVFGELYTHLKLDQRAPLSKYELMTLYYLKQQGGAITVSALLSAMEKPIPLKTYPESIREEAAIGSATSRYEIIKQLIDRGLVNNTPATFDISAEGKTFCARPQQLKINGRGSMLLTFIHPKTYDQDLPFRLLSWMNTDRDRVGETERKMQRYINQIFGRQLRFQRKRFAMMLN